MIGGNTQNGYVAEVRIKKSAIFWACAVERVRLSLCCSTMPNARPNVSISRCAYASSSQNANLLRSFINREVIYNQAL